MKKTAISLVLIFVAILCYGQQINKAEYFIDSDPGYGLATEIPIVSPANHLTLSFNVDVSELTKGFHMMVLRARDDLGRWSNTRQQVFYVFYAESSTEARIDKAEYFINTDPGFGLATEIPIVSPENYLTLNFEVDVNELAQGFHMIVLRARDELGRWGNTRQQVFYVFKSISSVASNISGIEYYVDNDPGFGNGTFVNIETPGNNAVFDFFANMDDLNEGDHVLYLRAKDDLNRWSQTLAHAFSMINTGINSREVVSWLNMYPNPNDGQFNIELANMYQDFLTLKIHDLNGRTVLSKELYSIKTPVTVTLPPGIYMLSIETGEQYYTQKLIINR
jgi:hypothetical protein